jgi:hypothetical protein
VRAVDAEVEPDDGDRAIIASARFRKISASANR